MSNEQHLIFFNQPDVQAIPGVKVLEESRGWSAPRSTAKFCDDPDFTGRLIPKIPDKIQQSRFLLLSDHSWFLNGHRWMVNAEKASFFCDSAIQDERFFENLFNTDRDTGLMWVGDKKFSFRSRARKTVKIDSEIGLAVSSEPSNWGSFLFRIVPKIAWLKAVGVSKLLMYRQFQQQVELAELLGFSEQSIIPHYPSCDYEMEAAYIPSQCHTNGALDMFAREVFLGLGRKFYGKSRFGRKIYVSRSGGIATASSRRCVNENELCIALISSGFDIVVPDELSIFEQIAAFANADFVVGPAGAGMFNSVFCRPGTKLIDIESERHWIYAHCGLFSSLGLDFGIFWGNAISLDGEPNKIHRPFSVNVPALLSRIRQMESDAC